MFSNTQKQQLTSHLYAVGRLTQQLVFQQTNDKKLAKLGFLAGCLHDIGKVDPMFQDWVKKGKQKLLDNGSHIETAKFSFEKYARHNEISLLLSIFLIGSERSQIKKFLKSNHCVSTEYIDVLYHAIFWHHAKPIRKNELDNVFAIYKLGIEKNLESLCHEALAQIVQINQFSEKHQFNGISDDWEFEKEIIDDLRSKDIPNYKSYTVESDNFSEFSCDVAKNRQSNIVRCSLITADQLISALSAEELETLIIQDDFDNLIPKVDSDALYDSILKHSNTFHVDSERTKQQKQAAEKLAKQTTLAMLNGAAGCGKTKIALEWALRVKARKLYWIVPRVAVGESIFREITTKDQLFDAKVEIYSGELKQTIQRGELQVTPENEYLSGDIVITTIDQLVNSVTTHQGANIFTDFMLHHVVFDEFHEYIPMKGFNLLFAELINSKSDRSSDELIAKMLLVSATPHYLYLENLFAIRNIPSDIVTMPSSNPSHYNLSFKTFDEQTFNEQNPLYQTIPTEHGRTIVISNTAKAAQNSFIINADNENSILFHSKYTAKDKIDIFNQVFDAFKKGGNHQYDVLRSSPITQASLNITCEYMITEATSAENWCQRLGRLDRFGEFDNNTIMTAIPQALADKQRNSASTAFLASMFIYNSTYLWYQHLKDNLAQQSFTIEMLYQEYDKFYQNSEVKELLGKDLISSFKESAKLINQKVFDPKWMKPKKITQKQLKRTSLRGDSRYVQMAVVTLSSNGFSHEDCYASSESNFLTLSTSELEREIEGETPLSYHVKKAHQITNLQVDKAYNSKASLSKAVSADYPIYTSFTKKDLLTINDRENDCFIYYAVNDRQTIGVVTQLQLNQLFI